MKFYTDGSRINGKEGFIIGWSAVCESGVLSSGSQIGGSNINAEIFAIRDLLKYLTNKRVKILDNETEVEIVTDSLTSIQIINGYLKDPLSFNLSESINYVTADKISDYIKELNERNIEVKFKHVRGHGKDSSMEKEDVWGNLFADYVATYESQKLRDSLS